MNCCALVATHHKTGSAWMVSTFKGICAALGVRFINLRTEPVSDPGDAAPPVVMMHGHGFSGYSWLLENPSHRVLHLIRDPRDMIISGMRYHRVAAERWLHKPQARFGRLSYQDKLKSLPDDRSRYFFEMENTRSIAEVSRWKYDRPATFECKYEDLIEDSTMALFSRIALHLGFLEDELPACREAFWSHYIFGGMPKSTLDKKKHVQSGGARQWPEVFDREMGEEFIRRFGNILVQLGYERDHGWLKDLPEVRGAQVTPA